MVKGDKCFIVAKALIHFRHCCLSRLFGERSIRIGEGEAIFLIRFLASLPARLVLFS